MAFFILCGAEGLVSCATIEGDFCRMCVLGAGPEVLWRTVKRYVDSVCGEFGEGF